MMRRLLLACAFVSVTLVALAQEPADPRFRLDVLTVPVSVVVTDQDNRIVRDLKADQFRILEDGVRQEIESFQFGASLPSDSESGDMAAATNESGTATRIPATDPEALLFSAARRMVFLLDYSSVEFTRQLPVERAATRYVEEHVLPGDRIAVFVLHSGLQLLQGFTDDHEKLKKAFQVKSAASRSIVNADYSMLHSALPPSALRGAFQGAMDSDYQAERALDSFEFTEGGALSPRDALFATQMLRHFLILRNHMERRQTDSLLDAVQAIATGLRAIEGRKAIVMFSQGFKVGTETNRRFHQTVTLANRNDVPIYAIDAQGLATYGVSSSMAQRGQMASINAATVGRKDARGGESLFDRAHKVGSDARESAMRYLATATGGFLVRNTNDLYGGLAQIDEDLNSYYLLSYRPKKQRYDGSYRTIEVEVKDHPDYVVRHREGYRAVPPGFEEFTQAEYLDWEAALTGQGVPLNISLGIVRLAAAPSKPNVKILCEIPLSELEFEEIPGLDPELYRTEASMLGIVRDTSGSVVQSFRRPFSIELTRQQWAHPEKPDVTLGGDIFLPPGGYLMEVALSAGRRVGLAARPFRVPVRESEFQLSSLILSKGVESDQHGDASLEIGSAELVPAVRKEFDPGSTLIYFFQVSNYRTEDDGHRQLSVSAVITPSGSNRSHWLPTFQVPAPADGSSFWVSRFIDLADLPKGTYFLDVKVQKVLTTEQQSIRTQFVIRSDENESKQSE